MADKLFLKFELADGGVRGWIENTSRGGTLDAYPRATVTLHPGKSAHGDLASWVLAAATAELAALPKHATLEVTCPEIPGASYELRLTSTLEAPEHAPIVARVLLALEAAAQRPAGAAAAHAPPTGLPPIVAAWTAAAPALEALGMQRLDAELYNRDWVFLKLELAAGGILGWSDLRTSSVLDNFVGQRAELRPNGRVDSELARFVAGAAQPVFAALPKQARLEVLAPEIPGATCKVQLTSPIATTEHAVAAAQLLLALTAALR
jgi:hypothetical protein